MPMKRSIEPQMARWTITGVFFSPSVDIEGAEAFRQVEVDLRGAALPVAADGVAQHIFELRPVERALARIDLGLDAVAGLASISSARGHHALGVIPHRVVPTRFSGRVDSLTTRSSKPKSA
jgi:hypothetical protein